MAAQRSTIRFRVTALAALVVATVLTVVAVGLVVILRQQLINSWTTVTLDPTTSVGARFVVWLPLPQIPGSASEQNSAFLFVEASPHAMRFADRERVITTLAEHRAFQTYRLGPGLARQFVFLAFR